MDQFSGKEHVLDMFHSKADDVFGLFGKVLMFHINLLYH